MMAVVSVLLLLLLACHPLCTAGMELRIQAPDAELMLPPVSLLQIRQEGLPLSWENSVAEEFVGYLERGAFTEALAYFREKEGAQGPSLLDYIEIGDPGGQLKRQAAAGGLEPVGAVKGFIQDFNNMGQISAYMLYLIGHVYFSLEKYSAAETAFLTALGPMPDYTRVHESLGLLYLRMQRYEDARKHLARAAGLGLHTAEFYGARGYLDYRTGNFWGAASAFQKALMLKPDNDQWERGRLQALSRSHQHRDTLTLTGSMLKKHPDDAGLWLFRAKAAFQAGQREEALASLETVIRLGSKDDSVFLACAALHMEMGCIERAMALLKTGFADGIDFMRVEWGMSRLMQAEAWTSLGRMTASVRGKWDDLGPQQQSKVLTMEAHLDLHQGDETAAGDALEKAIWLDPSNADALISLAGIYHGKGAYDRAELLYQRAGAHDSYRERSMISLAQLAMDRDDYQGALHILQEVLKEFPDRSDLKRCIDSLGDLVLLQQSDE